MSSIGIKLPLTYNSSNGYTMIKTIQGMVKQNFKMLIMTIPGERVMEPNFGVGLHQYIFRNFSEDTPGEIEHAIRKQTSIYLPVIKIRGITFDTNFSSNTLRVHVAYSIPAIGLNDFIQLAI
ncbi:MAG: hypothetical protein CMA12_00895 [Euryarchaeota archaeon]|nr:hypothetical protein [Euryarchaeota archaeon]